MFQIPKTDFHLPCCNLLYTSYIIRDGNKFVFNIESLFSLGGIFSDCKICSRHYFRRHFFKGHSFQVAFFQEIFFLDLKFTYLYSDIYCQPFSECQLSTSLEVKDKSLKKF